MMNLRTLGVLIFSLLALGAVGAGGAGEKPVLDVPSIQVSNLQDELTIWFDSLAENHYEKLIMGSIKPITLEYSASGSAFSRWVEDEAIAASSRSSVIKLKNMSALEGVRPDFREVYGSAFSSASAPYLLEGRYFPEPDNVRLELRLTDGQQGTLVKNGTISLRISRNKIPSYASLNADNQKRAQDLIAQFKDAPQADALRVRVSPHRGENATYRLGEYLTLNLALSRDAHVRMYHINVKGEIMMIFPNRLRPSDEVRQGDLIRIPDEKTYGAFAFKMEEPLGTEVIHVVASTEPFPRDERSFEPLGTDTSIIPKAGKRGQFAEATTAYTIIP